MLLPFALGQECSPRRQKLPIVERFKTKTSWKTFTFRTERIVAESAHRSADGTLLVSTGLVMPDELSRGEAIVVYKSDFHPILGTHKSIPPSFGTFEGAPRRLAFECSAEWCKHRHRHRSWFSKGRGIKERKFKPSQVDRISMRELSSTTVYDDGGSSRQGSFREL